MLEFVKQDYVMKSYYAIYYFVPVMFNRKLIPIFWKKALNSQELQDVLDLALSRGGSLNLLNIVPFRKGNARQHGS